MLSTLFSIAPFVGFLCFVVLFIWFLNAFLLLLPSFIYAKTDIPKSKSFSRNDTFLKRTLLVLGDSLAVGVGARSASESIAGRIGIALGAQVDNQAISGSHMRNIEAQLNKATLPHYDVLLLQVGGNDIIYFTPLWSVVRHLEDLVPKLKEKSPHVILLLAGDVGSAPLWPFPLNKLYTRRTHVLRRHYTRIAEKHGLLFVDLYELSIPFRIEPKRFYARDRLHLSGEGYRVWAEYIMSIIQARRWF